MGKCFCNLDQRIIKLTVSGLFVCLPIDSVKMVSAESELWKPNDTTAHGAVAHCSNLDKSDSVSLMQSTMQILD